MLLNNCTGHNVNGVLCHHKKIIAALDNPLNETGKFLTILYKNLVIGILINPNKRLLQNGVGIIVKEDWLIIFLGELGGGKEGFGTGACACFRRTSSACVANTRLRK